MWNRSPAVFADRVTPVPPLDTATAVRWITIYGICAYACAESTWLRQEKLMMSQRKLLGIPPAPLNLIYAYRTPEPIQRKPLLPPAVPQASPLTPPQRTRPLVSSMASPLGAAGLESAGAATAALVDYLTPITGSTGISRPSPKSAYSTGAGAVATPEQLRFYLDSFESDTQSPGPGAAAAGFAAYSGFAFPFQAEQQESSPGPSLPSTQDAPKYRASWLPRAKAAAVMAPDVLSPAAEDEVADFMENVLKARPDWLNTWTENLREWLSAKVLNPLVAHVKKAHEPINQILVKYQQRVSLPSHEEVIGVQTGVPGADVESLMSQLQQWSQRLYQPNTQQGQDAMQLAIALHNYEQLLQVLRGRRPQELLPPAPSGYIWCRVQALAQGTCMPAYKWNGGGSWGGRSWSADLPNDSILVLYLFAAFLDAPGWEFHMRQGDTDLVRGMPLFLGQLKTRPPNQYSAILSYRPEKPSKDVDAVLALNAAGSNPMMCFMCEGRILVQTGYQALFHVLVMFLQYHSVRYNGALGLHYLHDDALDLAQVVKPPRPGSAVRPRHRVFGWWFPPGESKRD